MKKSLKNIIGILLLPLVVLLTGCKEEETRNVSAETLVIHYPESVVTLDPETQDSVKLLTATVMPENAGNKAVFWKSSDTRIASISDEGLVKAGRPGTVTVTAIAYSNTEIRSSIPVLVKGIPDDVVSGVAGSYTGVLTIPTVSTTPGAELTLQREGFYSVRLITSVDLTNASFGVVPISILTTVDRKGERYTISGEGTVEQIGSVKVTGTVDADGNIDLEIEVVNFSITATYVGKNVINIEELVTGTYVGDVMAGAPVGSNVEVIIKREDGKYKFQIQDTIADFLFSTELEITVLQDNGSYTIRSAPGQAILSKDPMPDISTSAEIKSGTITAAGNLTFDIEILGLTNIGAPTNTATYTGQKQ
jgi:hypothetical protein